MKNVHTDQLRPHLRPVEWVALVFFAYTAVLATVLPLAYEMRLRTVIVSAAVWASMIGLVIPGTWFRNRRGQGFRDCYVLALIPLAYKMMGWFAPESHDYALERVWIGWDRVILIDWGGQQIIQSLGPPGPWLLELVYLLVYAVGPFCVVMLYAFKREDRVSGFLLTYLLGLFLSYAQFPFWPSEPPRTVFPGELEPFASWVRTINLHVVGKAGIHTSVFPSAHVSGAFAAALAFWSLFPDKEWLRRGLIIYAALVATATVYGRYHYAIDAAAGVFVAVIAFGLARLVTAPRSRAQQVDQESAENPNDRSLASAVLTVAHPADTKKTGTQ